MSNRAVYPPGVPCWVDTLQPDARTALRFYEAIFGWQFVGPGATAGSQGSEYFVARKDGRDVAGVGSAGTRSVPVVWNTYVSVADADEVCARAQTEGGSIIAAPFDAPPAGRIAVIADPSGAVFCLWEPRSRAGAQCVNEPSAWAMSALMTSDLERAATFYNKLFGWETETFDAGGIPVTLFRLPGYVGGEPQQPVPRDVVAVMLSGDNLPPGTGAAWSVDFWIDDVDRAVARATELGGHAILPPHDVPAFRRAVLADPQGAIFSISRLR